MRPVEPQGPIQAVRTLGGNLLGLLRERVALVSLELEEERERLLVSFIWIGVAMMAATMTLVLASILLVYLFWDTARLAVLGSLTVFYALALVAILAALRRHLLRQPRPFAATLAELDEDRSCLRDDSN